VHKTNVKPGQVISLNDQTGKGRREIAILHILGVLLLLLALTLLIIYGCPFYELFGIPCPCCGVTRAWLAFLRGDITLAFQYHALFLVIPPMGILYLSNALLLDKGNRIATVILSSAGCLIFLYAVMRWFGFVIMP
jgi:hypothetical protein